MSEITVETFKEAARRAVVNLDGQADGDSGEGSLRSLIKSVLSKKDLKEKTSERRIAEMVAERLDQMIWPEYMLEVKRAEHMQKVDREAANRYIIQEVRRYLEEEKNAG